MFWLLTLTVAGLLAVVALLLPDVRCGMPLAESDTSCNYFCGLPVGHTGAHQRVNHQEAD